MGANSKSGVLGIVILCAVLGVGLTLYLTRGAPAPTPVASATAAPTAAPTDKRAAVTQALGRSSPSSAKTASPAPVRKRTLKDRERRDDLRRRIYAAFGEEPPPQEARRQARPKPAPLAQAPAAARGSLDKQYIQDRIREDFVPLAKECYEAALERDPKLGGKLKIDFEIVGDESVGGVVESAELSEDSEIQDEEFMYCMRESMLSMSFEPPKGGGSVSVTYPFSFSSGEEDALDDSKR